ncbi:MAG: nickel pincer cofactor biosynthesis protein LarB [Desulfonatronovibrionaceae bacterium]
MFKSNLLELLNSVAKGQLSPQEARDRIHAQSFIQADGGLNLDIQRRMRTGVSEVVFGPGKTLNQLECAISILAENNGPVMVTRLERSQGLALLERFPQGNYLEVPGIFIVNKDINFQDIWPDQGRVMVVSAGGSDLPVALEALVTCAFFDLDAGLVSDVGVAGLHRLFPWLEKLNQAEVIIVAAGMEGALASVVAGLCSRPVLAVPTSVGYGAGQGGLAALMAMLSSCAPGVSVLNIDNGFGAACFAVKMLGKGDGRK